jgi:hypothetical protein
VDGGSIRDLPILADTPSIPSSIGTSGIIASPGWGWKEPAVFAAALWPCVNHNTQPEVLLLAGHGNRRVHRPTAHTTQPPKITKNSNLTTKTPQNEEKEYIFVIYALKLATA